MGVWVVFLLVGLISVQSFATQVLFGPEVGITYNKVDATDEQKSFIDPFGNAEGGMGYVAGLNVKWLMKDVIDVTLGMEVQKWNQLTPEVTSVFAQGSNPALEYPIASKFQVWTITFPIKSHVYYTLNKHKLFGGIGFALGVPRYYQNTWLVDGKEFDISTILSSQNIWATSESNVDEYIAFFSTDLGYSFEVKDEVSIYTRVEYKTALNSLTMSKASQYSEFTRGYVYLNSLTLSIGAQVEFGQKYKGIINQ